LTEELFEKVPAPPEDYIRVPADKLKEFVKKVFMAYDVPEEDAEVTADVLVAADLRGIESHGVQRLKRYIDGLKNGVVKPRPNIKIVREGPTYALIDGDFGLGQPISWKAVKIAIEKAKKNYIGMVGVYHSNHHGIEGYWVMKMVEEDLIGLATTNTRPLAAPTGGLARVIGTNPIAFGAPTKTPPPLIVDMASTIVPSGKIEVYRRKAKPIPEGWVVGPDGKYITDPEKAMPAKGGILLPLGGLYELMGGHKGYCLNLILEVLSGVLTGSALSYDVGPTQGPKPSNVGHFFLAINVEAFMPLDKFKERMDELIKRLKSTPLHPEFKRIWIPGEKSYLTTQTRLKIGVPVYKKVYEEIKKIGEEVGVKFPE